MDGTEADDSDASRSDTFPTAADVRAAAMRSGKEWNEYFLRLIAQAEARGYARAIAVLDEETRRLSMAPVAPPRAGGVAVHLANAIDVLEARILDLEA